MSRILIDDKEYEVNPQHNLLQAILSLGLDLPYFCWHPELGSVGSCRQCAVLQYKDEEDRHGRLVVACMTPVEDGMRIGLEVSQAQAFRATVIEALMTNHPHDCPVCEEGGECHLQDMTEMSGHTFRRYRGLKRTHRNQYLGPFINHEMNRCIACYRCVRFYQDYAGGRDLGVQAAHNHVYFGRAEDGVLESTFSGNLVEICPTGVFTDRTYSRRFSRKWDQQCAPSVCAHCAVGCNTLPAERYGRIIRIGNRFQPDLNGYFLCDRGRFGYDYQNAPGRLLGGYRREDGEVRPENAETLLDELLEGIADPQQLVLAVGSPRTSLENNFALACLVGEARFHAGIASREWQCLQQILNAGAGREQPFATLQQVEQCDAALVIGEDIAATAPRLALSLRQLVRNRSFALAAEQKIAPWQDAAVRGIGQSLRSPLWQLVPCDNALSDISDEQWFDTPQTISRLAEALAERLAGTERQRELEPQQQAWVEAAAQMLRAARQPLLVAGCGLADPRQLRAAAAIAAALQGDESSPKLYLAAAESNSLGLAALCSRGLDDLLQALDDAQKQGRTTTLVVLENDLQRRLAPQAMRELRRRCDRWLVLDGLETPTTQLADAAVAVPTQFEQQGTLVNAAGMLQRAEAVMSAQSTSPWRQFADAVRRSRYKADDPGIEAWSWLAQWHNADQLRADLAAVAPVFGEIVVTGPEAGFRIQGRRLARQGPRYGGRTAIRAGVEVRETTPPEDPDSPWNFSMEGSEGIGEWRAAVWAPGWNSVQALGKFQRELGGDWRDSRPRSWLNFLWLQPREVVDRDAVAVSGSWQLIPRFEVFAGEALSDCAGAIRERAGAAVLGIDSAGASRLGLGSWDSLELHYAGEVQTLHVRVDPSLPPSSLAIPQRAGLWCAAADPSPELALKPAVEPLPRPPQLIATDREAGDG